MKPSSREAGRGSSNMPLQASKQINSRSSSMALQASKHQVSRPSDPSCMVATYIGQDTHIVSMAKAAELKYIIALTKGWDAIYIYIVIRIIRK